MFSALKHFDVFTKQSEDTRIKTKSGAIISVVAITLMALLFLGEVNDFLTPTLSYDVSVDTVRHEKLRINIDITFNMKCEYLSADVMDATGEVKSELSDELKKVPVEYSSVYRNPLETNTELFGFRAVMNHKKHMLKMAQKAAHSATEKPGDACRIYGQITANKVAGNFHFSAGKDVSRFSQHVHDMSGVRSQDLNFTHRIDRLSFGVDYPGILNPLDFTEQMAPAHEMLFQYFVKVVPTTYKSKTGSVIFTNQFAVTDFSRPIDPTKGSYGLPGVFIKYDMSSVAVTITESFKSLSHFLTHMCAIIGGIFTVASLVDMVVYSAMKKIGVAPKEKVAVGY